MEPFGLERDGSGWTQVAVANGVKWCQMVSNGVKWVFNVAGNPKKRGIVDIKQNECEFEIKT